MREQLLGNSTLTATREQIRRTSNAATCHALAVPSLAVHLASFHLASFRQHAEAFPRGAEE
jgi:hypothetical protein